MSKRRSILMCATIVFIAGSFAAWARAEAANVFLKIDGIQGESQDAAHKDEIELISWSLSDPQLKNNTACVGRKRLELAITKPLDKTSPRLFQAFGSGEHLREARLSVRKAGSKSASDYLKYRLLELKVVSYGVSGTDFAPLEQVIFSFGKSEMEYRPQKSDGSQGSPITSYFE